MFSKTLSLVIAAAFVVSTSALFAQFGPAPKVKRPAATKSAAGGKKSASAKAATKPKVAASAWNPKDKYETELGAPPLGAAEISPEPLLKP